MTLARIESIGRHEGQRVELRGWLRNRRSSGRLVFLILRDGTGDIQATLFKPAVDPDQFKTAKSLPLESSLIVRGDVVADERAPGGYELQVAEVQIVARAEEYPITKKEHGVGFLLDHRHLWIRSRRQHAVLRIRAEVARAARSYLDEAGFLNLDAPILTPAACEGTTTLFETTYFDTSAYLSQSGQLYNEATAAAFGRVYCFGPTFRAEKSKTRRHLMEFWMLEPEMAFADLDEVISVAEGLVAHIVRQVLERRRADLETLGRDLDKLAAIQAPFPRITYDEALEILAQKGMDFEPGSDFGAPEETALSQHFDRPLFITHYPAAVKAFYMKRDPERPDRVLCVDLIAPEGYGEIIGGGTRMESVGELEAAIQAHGLPREAFEWYLDLRRYGSVPHGGFGLGLERTVAWLCGIEHVREAIPFPRMLYRLAP